MNQEKIGNFIKKIRIENKLTQKELAEKLGVTFQAVSKWENGKNIPDILILQEFSRLFNVDINEILSGEANKTQNNKEINNKQKKIIIVVVILLLIITLITSMFFFKKSSKHDFEFTTISSKCSDFKLTGSAAYNKERTSLYISDIEFCGKDDNTEYKKINCTLYETYKNERIKISSCKQAKKITLKEFLSEININVHDYTTKCKELTSNNLYLEIQAVNTDNKTITYQVPIKLNDSCKK